MKQYAERDTEELGEHYFRHIDAMTREDLRSKAAIGAELAYRDKRIAELEVEIERLTNALENIKHLSPRTMSVREAQHIAEKALKGSVK